MSGVTIEIDTAPVISYLRILSRKTDNMAPVMRAIGEIVIEQTDRAFEEGRSPGGKEWEQSERVKVDGGQTLIDKARLRNSITKRVSPRGVEVGTNVVYAATHQFGAMRGAFGRNKRNAPIPWGNIPARPYLPDSQSIDWDEILDVITRHLSK